MSRVRVHARECRGISLPRVWPCPGALARRPWLTLAALDLLAWGIPLLLAAVAVSALALALTQPDQSPSLGLMRRWTAVASFVPAAMCLAGVVFLVASRVDRHRAMAVVPWLAVLTAAALALATTGHVRRAWYVRDTGGALRLNLVSSAHLAAYVAIVGLLALACVATLEVHVLARRSGALPGGRWPARAVLALLIAAFVGVVAVDVIEMRKTTGYITSIGPGGRPIQSRVNATFAHDVVIYPIAGLGVLGLWTMTMLARARVRHDRTPDA
jgi:hypothetical protein